MAYDDQLLSVMSKQHTELYKCMIWPSILIFITNSALFSANCNTLYVSITSQALCMCVIL